MNLLLENGTYPHSFGWLRMVEELRTKARAQVKYRVDVYVGSDNNSRKIDQSYLGMVKKWANETFPDGYTIIKGEGYYNGILEDAILLSAFVNSDIDLDCQLEELKRKLRQELILLVKFKLNYGAI